MFIRSIELENFKSFRSRQKITAARKNIIIGKNGSGKSNLLAAIGSVFLFSEEGRPQYNSNEDTTAICVEIDNADRRFLMPATFSLRLVHRDRPEFFLNDRPASREELRGLFENAGFTQESFVMQGKVNDVALMTSAQRFAFIARIAGVEKYEDSKSSAIRLLSEDNEERVESLIEKIEMKMKITEDYKKKAAEYDKVCREKAEADFELMNYELKELNEEIDSIVVEEQSKSVESDEGMVDCDMRSCREEINSAKLAIDEAESFVSRFDKSITGQLRARIEGSEDPGAINPYCQKVLALQTSRDTAYQALRALEHREAEKYIELKALKYFDALGSSREDVALLEEQLRAKKSEIDNFQGQKPDGEALKDLVGKRKQLWIREKHIKDELCKLKELEKSHENKILYLGRHAINIFDTIKGREGVHGTVYSLFDVPDEFMDAYESITRGSLFWIVVSNEDVATKLIGEIDGRVSFVALNRVKGPSRAKIADENLIKLSEQIKCDSKYKSLLEMICMDYYVTSDVKTALALSEKYNVSVATRDGDVCNKNGSITGGYERSNLVLRELKGCRSQISTLERAMAETTSGIGALNERIKYSEMLSTEDSRVLDNLKAIEKYLAMKIEFMRTKKISVPQLCDLEMEYNRISESIPQCRLELGTLESLLNRAVDKKERLDEIIQKIQAIRSNQERLQQLKLKEKGLVDSMYVRKASDSLEADSKMQRKHMLIDKRTGLMRKMGLADFRQLHIKQPKDQLVASLREIHKSLKQYYGFSRKELLDDQRAELKSRLEELRGSKAKILEFIAMLDQRREDTMNLTFSMVADNYSYFHKLVTGDSSSLSLKNGTIDILVNGKICDVPSMSGGQKTVIALCLIFAVQKNDPSPFYVFDEIDANLDRSYCEKLYEIIGQSSSQYFITSFKEESIRAGDRFFGVAVANKESLVAEIDKSLAVETIKV